MKWYLTKQPQIDRTEEAVTLDDTGLSDSKRFADWDDMAKYPEGDNVPLLTIEELISLSQKGEALTWTDFEKFSHIRMGSGLDIWVYKIEDIGYLSIGSVPNKTPAYMNLVANGVEGKSIDIRTEDVGEFLAEQNRIPSEVAVQSEAEKAQESVDIFCHINDQSHVQLAAPQFYNSNPIGVGAVLDYVDATKVIFHGYFGLFVYDKVQKCITLAVDLNEAVGTNSIQGDDLAFVVVDGNGETIMLWRNSMVEEEVPQSYYIDVATGNYAKLPYEPFAVSTPSTTDYPFQGSVLGDLTYVEDGHSYTLLADYGNENMPKQLVHYEQVYQYLETEVFRVYGPYYDVEPIQFTAYQEEDNVCYVAMCLNYRDQGDTQIHELQEASLVEYTANWFLKVVIGEDGAIQLYQDKDPSENEDWVITTIEESVLA